MWLRYHPDGTALVHRSLAVGCHSTLSRPALPTHEYHGFNSSKRYGSCLFMCLSVISYFGVISRVGGKGKRNQSPATFVEQSFHVPTVNSGWSR